MQFEEPWACVIDICADPLPFQWRTLQSLDSLQNTIRGRGWLMYVCTICKQFHQLKRSRELKQREVVLPMQESRGRGFNTTQAGLEVCAYILVISFQWTCCLALGFLETQKSRVLVTPYCHQFVYERLVPDYNGFWAGRHLIKCLLPRSIWSLKSQV